MAYQLWLLRWLWNISYIAHCTRSFWLRYCGLCDVDSHHIFLKQNIKFLLGIKQVCVEETLPDILTNLHAAERHSTPTYTSIVNRLTYLSHTAGRVAPFPPGSTLTQEEGRETWDVSEKSMLRKMNHLLA